MDDIEWIHKSSTTNIALRENMQKFIEVREIYILYGNKHYGYHYGYGVVDELKKIVK